MKQSTIIQEAHAGRRIPWRISETTRMSAAVFSSWGKGGEGRGTFSSSSKTTY